MQTRKTRKQSTTVAIFAPLIAAFALGHVALSADTWSSFQNGGHLVFDQADLPAKWSPSDGIAWEVKLAGYGQSSPVAHADIVYVTSVSGDMKQDLHIEAIDRLSGKQLWQVDARNSTPEKSSNYVSRAAPSPVCDADGVIAQFEGGNVIAVSVDGKVRWKRDLSSDYGEIKARHGLGSSLEQNDTHIFAWIERESEPYVVALSKKTGETTWKSAGLGVTSWSSPRLVPVGEGSHLVLSGIGKLAGIDPETGERLWEFDEISGNSTPTPIPLGGGRFLIGASVGRGESGGQNAAASNGVVQIEESDGGAFEAKFVWRAKRATSSFGSPVVHQGYAYFVNRSGVVYCLDVKTGEEQFAERSAGSIWATPIAVGDRVYLFGRNGTTTVIKSGPAFEELSVNDLWKNDAPPAGSRAGGGGFGGPVLYAAAIAGDSIVLRRGDVLYAAR